MRLSEDGQVELCAPAADRAARTPLLRIDVPQNRVFLFGIHQPLPGASLRLLTLLAEASEGGRLMTATEVSEEFSGRAAKNIVSQLKTDLLKGLADARAIDGWFRTDHKPETAYRLQVPREQVEINR